MAKNIKRLSQIMNRFEAKIMQSGMPSESAVTIRSR
jgi:hypothetical protein